MSIPRGAGGAIATAPSVAQSVCSMGDDDDHDPQPGTKKRKGPVPAAPGSDGDIETGRDGADRNPPRSAREDNDSLSTGALPIRRLPRSAASKLALQRRTLFHKRKGALVALYCDAQGAWDAANKPKPGDTEKSSKAAPAPGRPSLPDVSAFERLLPALEDMTVWAPDAPGWREGDDAARPTPRRSTERWRTAFARRKRIRTDRVPIIRGGWAPEGSFELDYPTTASSRVRSQARECTALARLAEQLRTLVLSANRIPSAPELTSPPPTPAAHDQSPTLSPKKKNGKKKKKKRTTLANEGNPHHVDKYRPSRPVPVSNPYEPWPYHSSLLFPPSMRILAARPGGLDVRPAEDDYICVSCQYALFYGTEARRKQAIRQRKAELKRREKLRARVLDVGLGHRSRRLSDEDEDEDDDDDYEDEEDDCEHGRCSCGRPLHPPYGEAKPPDKHPAYDQHAHSCL